jgi:ribonuclease HIII
MQKPNSPTIFVTTVDLALANQMITDITTQGFEFSTPPYTIFSAKKKDISCTFYHSGKLTVQGKGTGEFVEFYLEPHIVKNFQYSYASETKAKGSASSTLEHLPHIGIDESGKGDFFGPLCIAGVYASEKEMEKLRALGVKDSKALTDKAIIKIAHGIKSTCAHHIVKINPRKYNELYEQFKNLNRLLAWGHATAIENLVLTTQCKTVMIDQFANEHVVLTALKRKKLDIALTQRHRAEEDLVVAAASILARETFLQGLKMLEEQFDLVLPKGASSSTIAAGKAFVRKHGKAALAEVGKLHFKTASVIGGEE